MWMALRYHACMFQVSSEFYKQRPSEEKIPAKDLTGNTECKTEVDK